MGGFRRAWAGELSRCSPSFTPTPPSITALGLDLANAVLSPSTSACVGCLKGLRSVAPTLGCRRLQNHVEGEGVAGKLQLASQRVWSRPDLYTPNLSLVR